MDCPKCNGNGEMEKTEFPFEEEFMVKQCVYCSGTGYIETVE